MTMIGLHNKYMVLLQYWQLGEMAIKLVSQLNAYSLVSKDWVTGIIARLRT